MKETKLFEDLLKINDDGCKLRIKLETVGECKNLKISVSRNRPIPKNTLNKIIEISNKHGSDVVINWREIVLKF